MSRKCKTVSFDLEDKYEEDLLRHVESQGKFSRYVKRLIANDMNVKPLVSNIPSINNEDNSEKDDYTKDAMSKFL